VALSVAMVAGLLFSRFLLADLNLRMVERLRQAMQQRLLAAEVRHVRGIAAGELASRAFTDAGRLVGFVQNVLKRAIGEGFLLAGAVAMMLFLDWGLALLVLTVAPLVLLLMAALGRVIRRLGTQAQEEIGRLTGLFVEEMRGITAIKAVRAEEFEERRFAAGNADLRDRLLGAEWWAAVLFAAVWLVTSLALLAIIARGSHQVMAGSLTAGGLLAFCLYALQTIEPARRLSELHGLLQGSLASAERVYEVIDLAPAERDGVRVLPAPVRGEIELAGVTFGYRPERPVLERASFRIAPREMVAIVSASGGGKSTLAGLLIRFEEAASGTIAVDGVDVRELRLDSLRRAVTVVEQEPFVFAGTLVENVRYGTWDATAASIEQAIELAGLRPFVRAQPAGAETRIDEGGRNLSGGQKQRIALARAILRDPAILVLDEATSALDSETEEQIFARLEPWMLRRTVVVMAHRLSTVSRVPRVLVLQGGRIVADGPIEHLLEGSPAFQQLFGDQASLREPAPDESAPL
ncbi:MAG: ATP-binding cassette, subfamily bacterial MsbA, partial [Candidatus Binatota bacterium]|nr:ATP-binding cassette, subfamily bacterial MsbA [Candidatus Binatota bacterium]